MNGKDRLGNITRIDIARWGAYEGKRRIHAFVKYDDLIFNGIGTVILNNFRERYIFALYPPASPLKYIYIYI